MLGSSRRLSRKSNASDPGRVKRFRILRATTIVASLVAVLVATVYTFGATQAIASQLTVMPQTDVFPAEDVRPVVKAASESDEAASHGQNILLLGSDARREVKSLADAEGNRADTIMVVNVPAHGADVTVMSIMRDNWVTIPEHGEAKINAALAFGVVQLMVQTVDEFIGARIDHVALVEFEGLRDLTDALGGVAVDNTFPFTSAHGGHTFDAGTVELSGDEALGYVRERYAFPDGDYQRVRNQQAFLRGILQSIDGAVDPVRILRAATSVAPYVAVDEKFSITELVGLVTTLRQADGQVQFFTSPTLGTDTVDGQSIVRVDWDGMETVRKAFSTDAVARQAASVAFGVTEDTTG